MVEKSRGLGGWLDRIWHNVDEMIAEPSLALSQKIQGIYNKVSPSPAPFLYPRKESHDYLFRKIEKRNITVVTEDDVTLTITNKRPRHASANLYPIMCLPGLAETRFVLDQALGRSFVDYLALNGFDVYMCELRGHGKSRHLKERYDWNVQTFLDYDVPAMIETVRRESGKDKLIWIGHSMGGMLLLGYLVSAGLNKNKDLYDADFIRGGITIGSPVNFNQISLVLASMLFKITAVPRAPLIPTDFLSNMLSMFPAILDSPLTYHFWNYKNIETENKILYLKDGLDNIATGVMRDFVEYVLSADFHSSDGKINYRENLFLIDRPMLIVSGSIDRMASNETAQTIYDGISSQDKELRVFGQRGYLIRDGQRIKVKDKMDYGHVDLTLGARSKEEVWPYMLNWIRKRAKIEVPLAESQSSEDGVANITSIRRS